MINKEITITISQLESLLNQQKTIVLKRLLDGTSYYNSESTPSHGKSLPIDKDKFMEFGEKADYPDDLNTLKKYLK